MARDIYSCLRLKGTLVAQSPLHVGGHGDDVDTDVPLARDGAGRLYIPGTSLAGALREHVERLFVDPLINGLWGDARNDQGCASFVVVNDLRIENADQVGVEVRDGVGIDRQWGAAAEHIKYDRAILPRGTRVELSIAVEVEHRDTRTEALAMVAALKDALERGQIRLGAAKTRGLGCICLKNGELTEQIYGTRQGILSLLRNNSGVPVPDSELEQARQAHPVSPRPRLTFTIHWKPVGPLMVKAGFDGIAVDMFPLTSGIDGEMALVLPGSSVKGALRSQAERIVRTVLQQEQPAWLKVDNARTRFLDAVELPLINELFGKRGAKDENNAPQHWLPGLGAMSVEDCYGQRRIPPQQWQAVYSATDDNALRNALQAAGLAPWSQGYHVAIDRWLGSAAESMLYSVLEPHRTEWEPLTLEVNLQRLPDGLHLPGLALLLLVIRDLAQNRLPLGFATRRGMGTMTVESVQVTGEDLPASLEAFRSIILENGQLAGLLPDLRKSLNQAWSGWIGQNRQEVTA